MQNEAVGYKDRRSNSSGEIPPQAIRSLKTADVRWRDKSCDIIIPVWNAPDETKECVESIIKYTRQPYRLIIVDNGSANETSEYLRSLRSRAGLDTELIRNVENLGFVKAVNQGMKASTAPYLCLMNNDTVATDGWLDEMIAVADAMPDVGIVNPSSNTFGQVPDSERLAGQMQELYSARGFCMLIKRAVVDKVGLFDEAFGIGYFEETDFSFRAQRAGFRIVRAKGAYVYHTENTSFKELKDNKDIFAANEKIFFKRWGRPIRVGYIVDGACDKEKIARIAEGVARRGHQVMLFLKRGAGWPVGLDHINIRRVDIGPLFFGLGSILGIFRRKRKKKLDIVLTDNDILGMALTGLKKFHGSEVMVHPEADGLLDLVDRMSKAS